MNTSKISISSHQLVEYVEKNEVAWQMSDSLISFSRVEFFGFKEEEKDGCEKQNNQILDKVRKSHECVVFNPESDNCGFFEDLIQWSKGEDLLILVDKDLLLCIAQCDREKVLAMVA